MLPNPSKEGRALITLPPRPHLGGSGLQLCDPEEVRPVEQYGILPATWPLRSTESRDLAVASLVPPEVVASDNNYYGNFNRKLPMHAT